jgi:hypothetical protein
LRIGLQSLRLLAVVALSGCGTNLDPKKSTSSSELASASAAPSRQLPPPQGRIAQIMDVRAIDQDGNVYGTVASRDGAEVMHIKAGVVRAFGWWCWVDTGRATRCNPSSEFHYYNLNEPPTWVPKRWDDDGDPTGYGVGWPLEAHHRDFVAARGADEIYENCFRRGPDVYTAGPDIGCPRDDTKTYSSRNRPRRPIQSPGVPGQRGSCWDPVKQPIVATRLFPGCFALDEAQVLHELFVLTPPREVARDVVGFGRVRGGTPAILFHDHRLQVGGTTLERRVREVSDAGVIFEDGAASIWWSDEQLLRPLTGFTGAAIELAGTCLLTDAHQVYCWPHPGRAGRAELPLTIVPAVFE